MTISGRGYRFVAPVSQVSRGDLAQEAGSSAVDGVGAAADSLPVDPAPGNVSATPATTASGARWRAVFIAAGVAVFLGVAVLLLVGLRDRPAGPRRNGVSGSSRRADVSRMNPRGRRMGVLSPTVRTAAATSISGFNRSAMALRGSSRSARRGTGSLHGRRTDTRSPFDPSATAAGFTWSRPWAGTNGG